MMHLSMGTVSSLGRLSLVAAAAFVFLGGKTAGAESLPVTFLPFDKISNSEWVSAEPRQDAVAALSNDEKQDANKALKLDVAELQTYHDLANKLMAEIKAGKKGAETDEEFKARLQPLAKTLQDASGVILRAIVKQTGAMGAHAAYLRGTEERIVVIYVKKLVGDDEKVTYKPVHVVALQLVVKDGKVTGFVQLKPPKKD